MSNQQQTWRPVVGYEDSYEVSDTGKVRSITRTYITSKGQVRHIVSKELYQDSKIIKESDNQSNTYKRVTLTKNNVSIHKSVHRLVAEAFIINNDPINKIQINHIDGNKANNSVENLEWCTCEQNIHHAHQNGLMHPSAPKGENAVFAAFTNEEVCQLRKLYNNTKLSITDLAKKYNCSISTLNNALFGRSYLDTNKIYPPCQHRQKQRGADNPCSVLNKQQIQIIKQKLKNGKSQVSLAKEYNVSATTIWRIANNLRYK